jgi:hypothetical protein
MDFLVGFSSFRMKLQEKLQRDCRARVHSGHRFQWCVPCLRMEDQGTGLARNFALFVKWVRWGSNHNVENLRRDSYA